MFKIEEDKLISSQYFLRRIQTIFSLIILPPATLALCTYLYHDRVRPETVEVGALVQYLILGFVVGITYLAYQYLFKGLKGIYKQPELSLRKRLVIYYSVVSRQLFVLTLAVAILSVAYLFTFDPYFFYLFLFVILFASLEWPTKHKIARHLRLKKEERTVIINQTEINE
jgi:hypothetical protein